MNEKEICIDFDNSDTRISGNRLPNICDEWSGETVKPTTPRFPDASLSALPSTIVLIQRLE
jgi:hypothetical protein